MLKTPRTERSGEEKTLENKSVRVEMLWGLPPSTNDDMLFAEGLTTLHSGPVLLNKKCPPRLYAKSSKSTSRHTCLCGVGNMSSFFAQRTRHLAPKTMHALTRRPRHLATAARYVYCTCTVLSLIVSQDDLIYLSYVPPPPCSFLPARVPAHTKYYVRIPR